MTTPAAPAGATPTGAQTPAPAPTNGAHGANGKSQPAPTGRDDQGRFARQEGAGQGAPTPVDDDPEIDFGEGLKLKRSAARSELGRARHSTRMLTEAQKRAAAADEKEKRDAERRARVKAGDETALDEYLAELEPEARKAYLTKYVYGRFVQPEQMSPEERAKTDAEKRAEAAEKKLADIERQSKDAEQKRLDSESVAAFEQEILDAAKAGRVPGTPSATRRVVAKMKMFEAKGLEVGLDDAVRLVREDMVRELGPVAAETPIAERKELWGPEVYAAERKLWLAFFREELAQSKQQQARSVSKPQATQPQTTKRQTMTPQEFAAKFGR